MCKGDGNRNTVLTEAVARIKNGEASCIVLRDGAVEKTVTGRGIAPILSLYDEGVLQGAVVADKVVGKAAAMVMTAGGITACCAVTVSEPALSWFRQKGVAVQYDTCVERIINRTGDVPCPMEQAVNGMDNTDEALSAIRAKVAEFTKK